MKEIQPLYLLRILHTIHYQLSIDNLIDIGLEYSQIAGLLSHVLQEDLVHDQGAPGLALTSKGVELLEKLNKEVYPNNSTEWILPLEENRIPKIDKSDIYLPRKKLFD